MLSTLASLPALPDLLALGPLFVPCPWAVDLLQLVFFVFIIASSLIGQAIKASQERARNQRRQRELEERELRGQRRAEGEQPRPKEGRGLPPEMARELEQLMGRVMGQPVPPTPPQAERLDQPSRPRPEGRPASERPASQRPAQPRPPATQRPPAMQRPQVSAESGGRREAGEREADARQGATVAAHVQQHLRPGEVGRNATSLGNSLAQADERMESHLQSTFDHRVGQLGGVQARVEQGTDAAYWSGATQSGPPVIERLHELLDSPQDIRAAFLLSEILRRPDFD